MTLYTLNILVTSFTTIAWIR